MLGDPLMQLDRKPEVVIFPLTSGYLLAIMAVFTSGSPGLFDLAFSRWPCVARAAGKLFSKNHSYEMPRQFLSE
jgi:hypothetical protein